MQINTAKFPVGTPVTKATGDYKYPGIVVSVFTKLNGTTRYVVESTSEDTKGMLHIFSENNLTTTAI